MATYTTTADAEGNFSIAFPESYTASQKITVTATKDSVTKQVELYAPSEPIPSVDNGWFSCSGTLDNFPFNIGAITLKNLSGDIQPYAFYCPGRLGGTIYELATGLDMSGCQFKTVGSSSFYSWTAAKSLVLPNTLVEIADTAFQLWISLTSLVIPNSVTTIMASAFQYLNSCTKLTLGTGLTSIGDSAFDSMTSAVSVTCLANTPPTIMSTTFASIKSTVKFYVPAASLAAYKAAPVWKTFANKIYAIS